jgi:anti-sigma factor RsiW
MGSDMDRSSVYGKHLTADEVETFALDLPARPRRAEAHLAECAECRREVASLRALDSALSGLGHLAPGLHFAGRVMARVRFRAPWYERAWAVTRERWVALAAASISLVAATSLMAVWLTSQPELSVGGLTGLMLQQAHDFSLQVIMAVGSFLWSSTLVRWIIEAAERIGVEGMILILSALSLVTISTAGAMVRLLQPAPLRLRDAS